jgi:hypothetical protein
MYEPFVADMMLRGDSCDIVAGASGPFGKCITNPIPVNGLIGMFKYMAKLRSKDGNFGLYFHRICSANNPISSHRTDVYETVSIDGRIWSVFFFDMYHPRRSNQSPEGYFLTPYNDALDQLPFCYGCDEQLRNFPGDLPNALERNQFPQAFIRNCKERLRTTKFVRPPEHLIQLRKIRVGGAIIPTASGFKPAAS